ncbi:ABATE domain-containing protein [uncultured Tessaracoccus sp.]|uniref:CGNR zinc finger domain-containing protein n=1 Tax=uncultured Tessaracoccus sp. TaxID=905023 RepID=UPI0025E82262|nr:ABATE domain-containing protein [uncultured Tessaracoccus sp.]
MRVLDESWVWDGGRPSIDFVNTLRARRRTPVDTVATPDALTTWLVTAGLLADGAQPATDRDVAAAARLRDALDALLGGSPTPRDLARINDCARRQSLPRLTDAAAVVPARPGRSVQAALGLVAADAVALVADGALALVKECEHERCGIRFVDTSPARSRRWCAMRRCGNRTKAARHAGRSRLRSAQR